MRQLLELGGPASPGSVISGHQSPAPTPSMIQIFFFNLFDSPNKISYFNTKQHDLNDKLTLIQPNFQNINWKNQVIFKT